jgi:hypothetical protein
MAKFLALFLIGCKAIGSLRNVDALGVRPLCVQAPDELSTSGQSAKLNQKKVTFTHLMGSENIESACASHGLVQWGHFLQLHPHREAVHANIHEREVSPPLMIACSGLEYRYGSQ